MKFYFDETKAVLDGLSTKQAAAQFGCSHSTISNRVGNTLKSLQEHYDIKADLFSSTDIHAARANYDYWAKLISDYQYDLMPEHEAEILEREWEALLAIVKSYIVFKGLPGDKDLDDCREIAKKLVS